MEQRFRIKHRSEFAIALADIAVKAWKTCTIVRGDRLTAGEHFDETAAPVAHAPSVKLLVAWAVAKGLLLFVWDIESAFYLNQMDRPGVIVQLTPGYDPDSTEIRPLDLPPPVRRARQGPSRHPPGLAAALPRARPADPAPGAATRRR